MTAALALLTSIFKAVPAFKQLWDQIVAAYVASQLHTFDQEVQAAIRKAIHEHDQRDLEQAIGSTQSGEASGLPGAVIVDDLGLHKPPKN